MMPLARQPFTTLTAISSPPRIVTVPVYWKGIRERVRILRIPRPRVHPTLGRFMSEDPKGFVRRAGLGNPPDDWSFAAHPDEAEFNLFRYCGNDPVDFTDPMGLDYLQVEYTRSAPCKCARTAGCKWPCLFRHDDVAN